jgi:hypothetical protein
MRSGLIEWMWGEQQDKGRPLTAAEMKVHLHCPALSVHGRILRLLKETEGCALPLEVAMSCKLRGGTHVPTENFVYWVTRPVLHRSQVE